MQFQKLIAPLTFILLTVSNISLAHEGSIGNPNQLLECGRIQELNNTMQSNLKLTEIQVEQIKDLNRKYLLARKQILETSDMIGQNTALLVCWNKWNQELTKVLNKSQEKEFLHWQSEVDLLAEVPF